MDSGYLGSGGGGGGGGGVMVGHNVVMEHMPKPQQKLRQTLHSSVRVEVGSVFVVFLFFCFCFP